MEAESPASPNDQEDGEILFVEDRTPAIIPSPDWGSRGNRPKPDFEETAGYLSFNEVTKDISKEEITDKVDGHEKKQDINRENDDISLTEDMLPIVEDRNPILSGQCFTSPKYQINEQFLKLLNQDSPKPSRFSNPCFNCGNEGHPVRDCPQPRDNAEIARNRREFQNMKGSTPGGGKRYHVEESQKYGHVVPGELSKKLRKALGVDKKELPSFVYKMRLLGYPPAWLEEATVAHSGIRVFDGADKEVSDPGVETGEVMTSGSLDKYDARKIFRWPGFNAPPPRGTYDDSQYWGCPPFSPAQSADLMLDRLSGRLVGGYRRKKLSLVQPGDDAEQNESAESQDMEYEETPEGADLPIDDCKFVPPLPEEKLPPPPPLDVPPEPAEDLESQSVAAIEDTSLLELEEQKKLLLAELNDTKPNCGTPNSRVGQVKCVELGTPILKSVSPYARLPSAEKFSVNICDVINFENLPDSTGHYEKMSGIIKNVRTKLSEIYNDD